jgi:hypothetical protein
VLVYFDRDQHELVQNKGRYHPWTVTTETANGRYVDFKRSPELIASTLEDLPYVEKTVAEAAIVAFLEWANGDFSIFETNDFGLRPLKDNHSGVSQKALEQMSRVTVLFRDLSRNVTAGDLVEFAHRMESQLREVDIDFDQACWGWCLWPHLFTALGEQNPASEGNVIQYQIWAWGDDALEVNTNMARSYKNLKNALEKSIFQLK